VVLDGGADEVPALVEKGTGDSKDGEVVGFRSTAGEDDSPGRT
jgi:hypothetical protein